MKLNVIIPAAGLGRRMKSYGNKSLISLGKETVLARQIRIVKETFKDVNIIVITGFESQKIKRGLPTDVKFIKNTEYETTNVAYSISLGLKAVQNEPTLIIYGDIVFNKETLSGIPTNYSYVFIDSNNNRLEEVGANIIDKRVVCMDYGLPNKWSHIAYLLNTEKELFEERCINKKMFAFEVLNKVVDSGGIIKTYTPENMKIAEIDSSKDIDYAKKIAKQ